MDNKQLNLIEKSEGFIAVLDQRGSSIPDVLKGYGITNDEYATEEEMFKHIHEMRTRVMTSPGFTSEHILGVILAEHTMNNKIKGKYTADYLWEDKRILSILNIDQGTEEKENGVRLMKPITKLNYLVSEAQKHNVFGMKMGSEIHSANKKGIKDIVSQQFQYGKKIYAAGFIPVLEIDVNRGSKAESEEILKTEILKHLEGLDEEVFIFRLSIPDKSDFYKEITEHPNVAGVVALLESYSQENAVNKLAKNQNLIASFSKVLLQDLHIDQNDEKFDSVLNRVVEKIYQVSLSYVLYLHPISTPHVIPLTNKL